MLNVNVSTRLLAQPGFRDEVRDAWQREDVAPSQQRLEVTEEHMLAAPLAAGPAHAPAFGLSGGRQAAALRTGRLPFPRQSLVQGGDRRDNPPRARAGLCWPQ